MTNSLKDLNFTTQSSTGNSSGSASVDIKPLQNAIKTLQDNETADDAVVAALQTMVDAIKTPDLSPYLKSVDASTLYALKSSLADKADKASLSEYTKTNQLYLFVATQAWVNDQLKEIQGAVDNIPAQISQALAGKADTSALSTETTARTNADTALDTRVTNLASEILLKSSTATVSALDAAYKAADTTEIAARSAADTALGKRIDVNTANITSLDTRITDQSTSLDNTRTNLGNRIGTVEQDIADLTGLLDDETTNRTSADTALETAYKAADTALGTRIGTIEGKILEPDLTVYTNSGGNTEYKIVIPDRVGAQPDVLTFRLYDRRTSALPNRYKDLTVPFSLFNHAGGSSWNAWIDGAYPIALWQDVTYSDGAVMRINIHYFVTPQGTIALDFYDNHSGNNLYGAVGNIRVTYKAKVLYNFVSVPTGLTTRRVCNITANNGTVSVNGLFSTVLYAGTSGRIKVDVPSGQEISSVTSTSSNVSISVADPANGALEVSLTDNASGNFDLSVTYQQRVAGSLFTTFNAGAWVSFKTLQWTIPSSGNRSLQIRAVSGSISARWVTAIAWDNSHVPLFTATIGTASNQYIKSDWNFGATGNNQTVILEDLTNNKRYRAFMQINSSFQNNVLVVEDIT